MAKRVSSHSTAKKRAKVLLFFELTKFFYEKKSKICKKVHFLAIYGMYEPYFSRMKHQSFAGLTIQPVTYYRRIQTIRMRSMHTELVSATGQRIEIHEHRSVLTTFPHLISRDRRLAVFTVHHLPRTVIWIWQKRKTDLAFGLMIYE